MKKRTEDIILSEHVLEVRHIASGSFLDVRGYVADYIRESGMLPHWKIDSNVVNFRDKADKVEQDGAFAGYKSAGYVVFNPETKNYFQDKAGKFWSLLIKNQHYNLPDLIRFGARTKAFFPSSKSFEEINRQLYNAFITEHGRELIGGKEKDFQIILDLVENNFDIQLRIGPIDKDEVGKYLNFESDQFKRCGLFFDIDVYKTNELNHSGVTKLLKEAMQLTWEKLENIANEVGI